MNRWRGEQETAAPLNNLLGEVLGGSSPRMPAKCATCQTTAVHIYFHDHRRGVGGVWVWCGTCRTYFHGSTVVPKWWRNLDGVDESELSASPDYLEGWASSIDVHWNSLRRD